MSDITVYQASSYTDHSIDEFEVASVNTDYIVIENRGNPSAINAGDVVKITKRINGVLYIAYGIAGDPVMSQTWAIEIYLDTTTYDFVKTVTGILGVYSYTPKTSDILLEAKTYSLVGDFKVSTFGRNFKQYNLQETTSLIIPEQRFKYKGNVRDMIVTPHERVFVDTCMMYAYGVAVSDITLTALNNNLRTGLNLNVLIK